VSDTRIFVSFDLEHDASLYELLVEQSKAPASGFEVVGGSEPLKDVGLWPAEVREEIRQVDQLIVICGEHTEDSPEVSAELRIAREEGTPYFLLWGRRETMCTKPIGAASAEGMYSWTEPILQAQISLTLRNARALEMAETLARAARKAP